MPTDVDEVIVAADATVSFAPVGTTGPTDIATALNAAFVSVGYTSEDGIEIEPGIEMQAIKAHQTLFPIRHIITGRSLDIGLTLLQWNEDTIKLALGGGTVTPTTGPPAYYTYTPPSAADGPYFRAMVLAWVDGSKSYRLHAPKVTVTDQSAITLARADASGIPLTVSVMMTDGAQPYTFITNDAGFAV